MFSVCSHLGGGQSSRGGVSPAGRGGQSSWGGVSPAGGGGGQSSQGGVSPARGGGSVQLVGGGSAKIGLTTRRAVCLLRSRRRTFLFYALFTHKVSYSDFLFKENIDQVSSKFHFC